MFFCVGYGADKNINKKVLKCFFLRGGWVEQKAFLYLAISKKRANPKPRFYKKSVEAFKNSHKRVFWVKISLKLKLSYVSLKCFLSFFYKCGFTYRLFKVLSKAMSSTKRTINSYIFKYRLSNQKPSKTSFFYF